MTTYNEQSMPVYADGEPMNPERLELSTNGLKADMTAAYMPSKTQITVVNARVLGGVSFQHYLCIDPEIDGTINRYEGIEVRACGLLFGLTEDNGAWSIEVEKGYIYPLDGETRAVVQRCMEYIGRILGAENPYTAFMTFAEANG